MKPEDMTGAALANHLSGELEYIHQRRLRRVDLGRLHPDVAARLRAKDLEALARLRASDYLVAPSKARAA